MVARVDDASHVRAPKPLNSLLLDGLVFNAQIELRRHVWDLTQSEPGPAGQKRFRDSAQLWFGIGGSVGKTRDDRRRVRGRHSIR
jgi:hypothetical protein